MEKGIRSAARGWSETQHRLVKACRRTAAASAPPSPDNRRFTEKEPSAKRIALNKFTLTKSAVDALEPAEKSWLAWDDKLIGFVMHDFIPLI